MSSKRSNNFKYFLLSLVAPVGGILISALLLFILILLIRKGSLSDTIQAFYIMWKTLTSKQDVGYIIARSEPLILSGIAAAIAFRAGVFNIGTEGQYYIGGLLGAVYAIYFSFKSPSLHWLNVILVIVFSMIGGALWALIPAILKVKKGVHEVITTIMMNQIAYTTAKYFVNGPMSGLKGGESLEPKTMNFPAAVDFKRLYDIFHGHFPFPKYIPLYESLFIALIVVVIAYIVIYYTNWGFELKMLGTNPNATKYSGVPPKVVIFNAMLWSGAIAGIINLQEIFGIKGYYTHHMTGGLGFDGIAVALIGYNNPIGVVLAALLFGFLRTAGYNLQFELGIPNSTMDLITGFIIIVMVIASVTMNRYISKLRRKEVLSEAGDR